MINYRTKNIEKYIEDFYFESLKYVSGDCLDYVPRGLKGVFCYIKSIEPVDDHFIINIKMKTIDEETISENSIVIKKGTQLEMYILVDERVACFVPPSFSKIPVLTEITAVSEGKFEIRCIGIGENYCKKKDNEERKANKRKKDDMTIGDIQQLLYSTETKIKELEEEGKTDSEEYAELVEIKTNIKRYLELIYEMLGRKYNTNSNQNME